MTDNVIVPRDRLEAACAAWQKLLSAWSRLRMDTPEDQRVHDDLVALTQRAVDGIAEVAWPAGSTGHESEVAP